MYGWDGHGALSIAEPTYNNAVHFVKSLAANEFIPMPDVTADPDGEVSFEWYRDKNWSFSVSLNYGCGISYAGIFGESKVSGTEVLDRVGLVIPASILQHIYRVYEKT